MKTDPLFIQRILMCRPTYFAVKYEINPWMNVKNTVDHTLASKQWTHLQNTLIRLGAFVDYIEPVSSLPDIVFTANAGLIYKKTVILSNFKYKERKKEKPKFLRWFEDHHYEIKILPSSIHFEGAGDGLFVGETLFLGYGFRSDIRALDYIADILHLKDIIACRLVDPFFYHLDTCFCPLNSNKALIFPGAFHPGDLKKINSRIETVSVPSKEAHKFACNAVVIGNDVVLSKGCPVTKKLLQKHAFNPHEIEMSEFMKSGGACKCLTLDLGSY